MSVYQTTMFLRSTTKHFFQNPKRVYKLPTIFWRHEHGPLPFPKVFNAYFGEVARSSIQYRNITGNSSGNTNSSTSSPTNLTLYVKLNENPTYVKVRIPFIASSTDITDIHTLIMQELRLTTLSPALVQIKVEGSQTVLDNTMLLETAIAKNILQNRSKLVCSAPEVAPISTAKRAESARLAGIKLRDAILNATETEVENGIKLVKLADPTIKFPGLGAVPLLIRDFYEGCYKGPLNNLRPNPKLSTKRIVFDKFIILGNPGIGKSAFGLYLLYRAIRKKRTVVYIGDKHPHAWIFHKNGQVTVIANKYDTAAIENLDVLDDDENILICDSIKPPYVNAFTVLITSPQRDRWKDFVKKQCHRIHFPVFSFAELEVMNTTCALDFSWEELRELYSWCGGIPRYMFESVTADLKKLVDDAITKETVRNIPLILSNEEKGTEKDYYHRLLHTKIKGETENNPKLLPTDPTFYDFAHLEIASDQLASKVIDVTISNSLSSVIKFLAVGENLPEVAVLYGKLLEKYFFYELENREGNGKKFTVRKLLDSGNMDKEESITIPTNAESIRFHSTNELAKLYKDNPSAIFIPQSITFGAFDGILPGGRFFNVTKNVMLPLHAVTKRESKNAGLVQIARSMGLIPSSSSTGKPTLHFYWVVTSEMYKAITKPFPIHEKGRVVRKYNMETTDGVHIQQYVVNFDLSSKISVL